jgi:hypothetical protein
MPEDTALGMEERAELERLRAEVARLCATAPVAAPGRVVGWGRWRTVVAGLLIVVGCGLAPLSVVAVWTRNQVSDTDRDVATVTPLARDPAIQAAITDQITAQVVTSLDVQGLTSQAVAALADRGTLPPPVHPRPGRGGPQRARRRRRLTAVSATDGCGRRTRAPCGSSAPARPSR